MAIDKKQIRDRCQLVISLLLIWLYIPHICIFILGGAKSVKQDIDRTGTGTLKLKGFLAFLYLIHNDRYFRSLFYHRIGPVWKSIIGWYRPGDRYLMIRKDMKIGEGCMFVHSFATVLNAESIGRNFTCRNNTTIGYGKGGRPTIGDNVDLGVNVTIIGGIHVGNNVVIGAGAVVVKDIPDNAVAVGNPAKVVRYRTD